MRVGDHLGPCILLCFDEILFASSLKDRKEGLSRSYIVQDSIFYPSFGDGSFGGLLLPPFPLRRYKSKLPRWRFGTFPGFASCGTRAGDFFISSKELDLLWE